MDDVTFPYNQDMYVLNYCNRKDHQMTWEQKHWAITPSGERH